MRGKNLTPRHGVHAACLAFGIAVPGGRGAAASAAGTLPDGPVSGHTSGLQRCPSGRTGALAGAGVRKCPLRAAASAQHFEMGHQVNSTFGVGRSRVASFVAGCAPVQSRQPAARAGRAHAGREARLGDAAGSEARSSAQKFHVGTLFPLLRDASALNYFHLAGKFILTGRGVCA